MTDKARDEADRIIVKPLVWRKPTDHPQDMEDALWIADGIGGHYSVSKQQLLSIGPRPGHLLWWPNDEFAFDEFFSVEAAKAAAQADYESRILSAIDLTAFGSSEYARGEADMRERAAGVAGAYDSQHVLNTPIALNVARNIATDIRALKTEGEG